MGDDHGTMTYEPLNTLKSVADDVWIVDGPVIRFGMPWPKIPFPTRMTIIRIGKSDLFVHSPTRLTEDLKTEIGKLTAPEVTRQGVEMVALCARNATTADTPQKREARDKLFAQKFEAQSERYLNEIRKSAMIEYR